VGPLLSTRRARRAVIIAAAVAAGAAALVGCGAPNAQIPPLPPQIAAVEAEYQNPTGTVPVAAMDQIAELQQKLDLIDQTHLGDLLDNALVALRTRVDGSGLTDDPLTTPRRHHPIIVGSVTITRTCRGWDDTTTTPNPADGSLVLTAEFQSSVLQRVIFGTATACQGRVDLTTTTTAHPFLDGGLALYLEGPLPSNSNQSSVLIGWNGTLGVQNGTQSMGGFDFRFAPPQIEVRVAVPDGHVIGSVGANMVSLRGSNGTFGCSLETFDCGRAQTARGANDPAP
jgi:hypothetical protein